MSAPTPESMAQQLYAYATTLNNDYALLQADLAGGKTPSSADVQKIEADISTTFASMQALYNQLGSAATKAGPGTEQEAIHNIMNSVSASMNEMQEANSYMKSGSYNNALTELEDVGGYATGDSVIAYRQTIQWAAVQIDNEIAAYNASGGQTAANAQTLSNLITGFQTYLTNLEGTPPNVAAAAGALGCSTANFNTLLTSTTNAAKDIAPLITTPGPLPSSFNTDWGQANQIIGGLIGR